MIQYYPAFEKAYQKRLYQEAGEIYSDRVAMSNVFKDYEIHRMALNRFEGRDSEISRS